MSAPVVTFYENDDIAVINAGNPLAFGNIEVGDAGALPAAQAPFHLWNDKGGGAAATMLMVEVGAKNSAGGNTGEAIENEYFEARSYGAVGCVDDAQSEYTPIGGTTYLDIGDIPAGACRYLYLRCNVPVGATDGLDLAARFVVSYWYEA